MRTEAGLWGAGRRDRLRPTIDWKVLVVLRAVAAARGARVEQLLKPGRGTAVTAESRQLAMYLIHTLLGRTYRETGRVFGRDRTTVSHACACTEDRRETRRYDRDVEAIEAAVASILGEEPANETR